LIDIAFIVLIALGWFYVYRKPKKVAWMGREYYRNVYLRSPHWYAVRAQKIKEAGGLCESCKKSGSLDVHHLSYKNLGHERMNDLQALCRKCHKKRHKK